MTAINTVMVTNCHDHYILAKPPDKKIVLVGRICEIDAAPGWGIEFVYNDMVARIAVADNFIDTKEAAIAVCSNSDILGPDGNDNYMVKDLLQFLDDATMRKLRNRCDPMGAILV